MRRNRLSFLFLAGMFCAAAGLPRWAKAEIPAGMLHELDRAVSLRNKGEVAQSYQALQRAMEIIKRDDLASANDHLRNAGAGSLEDMLLGLRSEMLTTGDFKGVRGSKGLETRLLVNGQLAAIKRMLAAIEAEASSSITQLNHPMEIGQALERSSRTTGPIDEVQRLFNDLTLLGRRLPKSERNLLDRETAGAVADRFEGLKKRIQSARQQSLQVRIELHFRNIETALEQPIGDAAAIAERLAYLSRVANSIEAIRAAGVEMGAGRKGAQKEAARLAERLAPLEGEFHAKFLEERRIAYDLEAGIRWWIRGRYGRGVERLGLLKDLPTGQSASPWNVLAQPLLMPDPLPADHDVAANFRDDEPVVCYIQAIHPLVTRRHYVLWGSFISSRLVDQKVAFFIRQPPTGTLEYAYFADEAPAIGGGIRTGTNADRIVGFIEYQMALAHFKRLLAALGDEEKEALDRLVAQDPRLKFYSCVSRLYDPIATNSSLRDPFGANDGKYIRAGLRWIMALARLELAAMEVGIQHAGATPLTVSTEPGEKEEFDRLAYRELLWDAARTHYYSMRYYLPTHAREGTYRNGELFKKLVPPEEYRLLKEEYAIAGALCKRLEALLLADEVFTPAMRSELGNWIGYIEGGEQRLNGWLLASQAPSSTTIGRATTVGPGARKGKE